MNQAMTVTRDERPAPAKTADVVAALNFLAADERNPRTFNYPPETGRPPLRPASEAREVTIRDMRPIADSLSLDVQGFALGRQETAVRDFYDEAEVKAVYYPEVERLVREQTGARRVVIFDHTVRHLERAKAGAARAPVTSVHNDYTEKSGPQRVRDLLPDEAEALLAGRFAVINVWRPIRGPVQDMPLAVCDAQSMGAGEFVKTDLVYSDRVGEIYSVRPGEGQRWYYAPEMQREEVLFLKCYDSATDGRARFMAHSAFVNPQTPAGAAPRESIEVRTLVFF